MNYKLVPVEATEAMLDAPEFATWAWRNDDLVESEEIQDGYKSMLAAAPEPVWEALAEKLLIAYDGNPRDKWVSSTKVEAMAAALREVLGG